MDILDGRTGRLFMRPRKLHGDLLDLGVVPLLVLGIARRDNQGMGYERHPAGSYQFGLAPKDQQFLTAALGQLPLLGLDVVQFLLCADFALAGSFRLFLPDSGQLCLLVVEAADQKLLSLGERIQEFLTMFGRHAAGDPLQEKRLRQLARVACGHGEPLGNGWQALAAPQQEQVLNRAWHDTIPVELLEPDEPVFDVFLVS